MPVFARVSFEGFMQSCWCIRLWHAGCCCCCYYETNCRKSKSWPEILTIHPFVPTSGLTVTTSYGAGMMASQGEGQDRQLRPARRLRCRQAIVVFRLQSNARIEIQFMHLLSASTFCSVKHHNHHYGSHQQQPATFASSTSEQQQNLSM